MFFRGGERLIIPGKNLHRDYQRYNEISRGIYTSKVGEVSVKNVYKKSESKLSGSPKSIELSLWRVTDKNVTAWERGIDKSEFVIKKPNGERVSYVVVPRMNTQSSDPNPYEYTEEKDATFEDIDDPRVIVIARSYKGVVAELAKDFILRNEEGIRQNYKFLTDDKTERYCEFSNPQFLRVVTSQAVQMYEPNVYATFHPVLQDSHNGTYSYEDTITQLIQQDFEDMSMPFQVNETIQVNETAATEEGITDDYDDSKFGFSLGENKSIVGKELMDYKKEADHNPRGQMHPETYPVMELEDLMHQ